MNLAITYHAFTPGDDTDQALMIYDTEPGSSCADALQLLASTIPGGTADVRNCAVTGAS